MSGWDFIISAGIVGAGMLLFLQLIADDLELAALHLKAMAERERKAYEKRLSEPDPVEVVSRL